MFQPKISKICFVLEICRVGKARGSGLMLASCNVQYWNLTTPVFLTEMFYSVSISFVSINELLLGVLESNFSGTLVDAVFN